ncbi:MAG: bifunctional diaminohydroxyphosphoribosylaminopyrimidine deaminase/5-amino-6-(5-phosphoribosylamino)uracil reductase RibD [Pseudomonadota bacterium]
MSNTREDLFSVEDERHMRRALEIAARGLFTTRANPRVGCVLVNAGRIVGEGFHVRPGEDHAEVNALRAAGDAARGATAYVTLEPCAHFGRTPPCAESLVAAGISAAVIGAIDPNPKVDGGGIQRLRDAGIAVRAGLMADASRALNPGFFSRFEHGRPFVRLKLAASLDGRTALRSGDSRWVTSAAARADVQVWRARACAVLTGVDTVIADDPALTVRINSAGEACAEGDTDLVQPLRVIVDSRLRTPPGARLLTLPGETLIFCTEAASVERREALQQQGAIVHTLTGSDTRVGLGAVLGALADREVSEVHTESGATLAGALLDAGLVDELLWYLAPALMGPDARPAAVLPLIERMTDVPRFTLLDATQVGDDVRMRLGPRGREIQASR